MKKIIHAIVQRCMGCRSCELACAVAHSKSKRLETAIRETPRPRARVSLEYAEGLVVPLQCRHCEDAPCIRACPTGAVNRENEDSPVDVEQTRCIGCQACAMACPFGVITMDKESRVILKCDLCRARLKAGQTPACVNACPTRALEFVEVDEIPAEKRKQTARKIAVDYRAGEKR